MPKVSKKQQAESLAFLRNELKPGDTVFTILRHVSASGMVRDISPITIHDRQTPNEQPAILHLWWHVANVLGRSTAPQHRAAVRCHGAGMDMGFDLVYSISHVLFDDGYALKHRWL